MTTEIWRPVAGLEDRYEASNLGRVKGIKIYGRHTEPRVIKTSVSPDGYEKIYIIRGGKNTCTRVHTLVCAAFHGPKPDGHEVNHKDGNKLNNTPENLEWVTRSQNAKHRYDVLDALKSRPRGKGVHYLAKWSDEEVRQIRALRATGLGYHKILAKMGNKTSWVSIQKICAGTLYAHVI